LQVVVGVILALKFGEGEELSKGVSTVLVVSICLFVVAYKWCRAVPPPVAVFVLFTSFIIAMYIFIILLLTETKHVPIEDIWMLFDRHGNWKRIFCRDIN
jgi:MFS transporter, SP family, sugar:H+ symporter